ncbi:MAG: hypothetical protein A2068_11565 [Ignavibacteria bacterium GWB2_35_6b]|nr:MAG: hypothetical protein A2068_11565 [Ignavibacteria bacterium GWB2_35_6b]
MEKSKPDKNILKDLVKDEESYNRLLEMLDLNGSSYLSCLKDFFKSTSEYFSRVTDYKNKTVEFSGSVKNVTGYEPDELINKPGNIISFILEEDLPSVKKLLTKIETDNNFLSGNLTYRLKRKDDEIIWLKETVSIERDAKKNPVRAFSIFTEISELKKSEIDFLQSKESLVEINKMKDRFLSIVSHDLRAPFTSLLGFSEILLNEPNLPFDERIEYLKYIYEASKTQLQLINHLLDWSKLQTGKITLEPKRINAKALISNCISVLTGAAMRKDIELKSDFPPDVFIFADERLLTQAVTNLINNSIKFTGEGKKIYVSINTFKEGMSEIVVRDEGVGISEENQDKLFRIDKKFSLEGTSGEKGSGLGLALVKEIIEKHGGDVWFYSKLGEGSEFHITVPEAKNVVVLVEDDVTLRQLYKKMITNLISNFKIIEAENGYEAMSIILNQSPSLVITDHDMPLMNGIQLVEAMRKKDANRNVPVIVISAKLNDDITKRYRELNVDKIITKPFKQAELIKCIKESVV